MIIDLHANRILGRLGSSRYSRPRNSTNFKRLKLGEALRGILAELEGVEMDENLAREVRDLLKITSDIESSATFPARDLIETAVGSAYALHVGTDATRFSFLSRLQELGVASQLYRGRVARQMRALANYWRICLHLTGASRTYHRIFRTMVFNVVLPGSKKRIIHAEIQLLLHHETSDQWVRPRIIPASKRPCLLCYNFMRAYELYQVLQTHGEIFQNWYIPERRDLSDDNIRRINLALQATALDVKSRLASFQAGQHGQDNP